MKNRRQTDCVLLNDRVYEREMWLKFWTEALSLTSRAR
jgi:hypothetical protein